jgi:hypothetical protein
MKPPSQNDRILAVLQDGQEHEMRDIHRVAGFCRLNSRVSELRKRGLTITCRREGSSYYYRLVKPFVHVDRFFPPCECEACEKARMPIPCSEPVIACVVDESAGHAEQLALTDSVAAHIRRDMDGTPL